MLPSLVISWTSEPLAGLSSPAHHLANILQVQYVAWSYVLILYNQNNRYNRKLYSDDGRLHLILTELGQNNDLQIGKSVPREKHILVIE